MLKDVQNTLQFISLVCAFVMPAYPAQATDVLYMQDFESPRSFGNNGSDFDNNTVNDLYRDQPPGFKFAQTFTVETVYVAGNLAYGRGLKDPSGIGGNYAIAMLATLQDDRLGLSFDTKGLKYLNLRMDISSIVMDTDHAPNPGKPKFKITLFDNPNGAVTIGEGRELDSVTVTGSASPIDTFDWTPVVIGLKASESTNGNVTLQLDLLEGYYAAVDNLRIAASDKEGDVGRRYAP